MKRKTLVILISIVLICSFIMAPLVKSSAEPPWLPEGWESVLTDYVNPANYIARTVTLDGEKCIAYPLEESSQEPKYLGHGWIIFDSSGNVVTDSDRYKKLALTAEWARNYDLLSSDNSKNHIFENDRNTLNKVIKGIKMYEGGKLVVSIGSEVLGIIAKIYAKLKIGTTGTTTVVQDFSSVPSVIRMIIMEKFDMASGTKECLNWMGKTVFKTPSQALAAIKAVLTYAAYKQIFEARNANNKVLDMFNEKIMVWPYDKVVEFQENLYSAQLGIPALAFIDKLLGSENWKSTAALIGNKFLSGFIGVSVEDLKNEWDFIGSIFEQTAPDTPIKKAYEDYIKAQNEVIQTLNSSKNAWDIDDEESLAYALYKNISKPPEMLIYLNPDQLIKFLPNNSTIIDFCSLPLKNNLNRAIILYVTNPVKYEKKIDELYSCPDRAEGTLGYRGTVRVALIDTQNGALINTLDAGSSPFVVTTIPIEIPVDCWELPYDTNRIIIKDGVKILKNPVLYLRDYNGDGRSLEFALSGRGCCSDFCHFTSLIGYSETQDKIIQYPVVTTDTGRDCKVSTYTDFWPACLFSEDPISPGKWKYRLWDQVGYVTCQAHYDSQNEKFYLTEYAEPVN